MTTRPAFDATFARRALIVLVAYYLSARLGIALSYSGSHVSLLWMPSGIAVAALWRWGWRMALPVAASVFLVGLHIDTPWLPLVQICIGNACGAMLSARILRRGGFDRGMARQADIALLLWAGAVGVLLSSINGVIALPTDHRVSVDSLLSDWLIWWIGDTFGVLLAGVPLLTFSRSMLRARAAHANTRFEILGLLAGLLMISLAAFARELPFNSALMFPLLSAPFVLMSMLALRHGIFVSSVAVFVLALLMVSGTAAGRGPFASGLTPSGSVLALWGYVVALSCTTMLICALAGELASSQRRMLALFSHVHDGLLLVDDHGCIAQANPAAATLLGIDASALRGQPLWRIEAGVESAHDSVLLGMMRRLGAPATLPPRAARLRRADGQEFDGECQVATYTDGAGQTQAHVVLRDVTASLRAEADRLTADAAVRANRAKTEFLSRMSHELRTPLNAVLGFAQLLERDTGRIPLDHQGNIGHILSAGTHLLHLIDEVLDLSRIEAGGMELKRVAVQLADVLEQSLAVVQPAATARGVALQMNRASLADVPGVMADAMRLHQVLVNLLDNALKYTERGGRVWLQCQRSVDPSGRDAVAIEVGDTGVGLSADQIGHLFEPFNRLGAERSGVEGTGIGLVISRRFVELMDGCLLVESQPGFGSVFRVVLPSTSAAGTARGVAPDIAPGIAPNQAADASTLEPDRGGLSHPSADTRPQPLSTGSAQADAPLPARREPGLRRVLYVEDNEVNLLLVEAILRPRANVTLVTAATGQAGLARARGDPPDLVLIDMQLPDMSGLELYRLLRRAPEMRGVRCVAVSANAMPDSIAEALAEGFSDYLTKPLKLELFNACLDRHLHRDA